MATRRGPDGRFATVRAANFEPKRVRKARRKALVGAFEQARGYVPNKIADARVEAAERAEFYRNLRMMKLHRRLVARAMNRLADEAYRLYQEVVRADGLLGTPANRSNGRLQVEAVDCARSAATSARVAADEWFSFSRRRMHYVKELEVAA